MSGPSPGAPERLDSWKAIAEYLDRDVATVRRWEKALGLPVRRVPGGRGRSVFAFRSEVDDWLKSPAAVAEPAPIPSTPARRTWLPPVLAAVALLAIGLLAVPARSPRVSPVTRVEMSASDVRGLDDEGVERWRHLFPAERRTFFDQKRPEGPVTILTGSRPGAIVSTSYSETIVDDTAHSGELYWFGPRGSVERHFAWTGEVTFGAGTYTSPWALTDYRLHPALGPSRVAVTAHHFQWWPGLLTLLDENWRPTQRFVNAGWIEGVLWLDAGHLLISGYFNTMEGGMVALLDADRLSGQSPPAGKAEYECAACGPPSPLRYVVLPRSEINQVTGSPFNRAQAVVTGDRILVRTIEMVSETGHAPEALYEFSTELELLKASYGDRYWEKHAALEAAGQISHSRATCPERRGPPVVNVWDPATGWTEHSPR